MTEQSTIAHSPLSSSTQIAFQKSIGRMLIRALVCAISATLFVGLCFLPRYITWLPVLLAYGLGGMGILFFVPHIISWLLQIPPLDPQVVFSEEGIEDRRTGLSVPWNAITAVWFANRDALCLVVDEKASYRTRMTPYHRWWNGMFSDYFKADLIIRMGVLNPRPRLVADLLELHHPELYDAEQCRFRRE